MTFEEACRQAASEFLQTVVLVDDRAAFNGTDKESALSDEQLVEPDDLQSVAAEEKPKLPLVGGGEGLDAGVITKGFADRGLICAVLKPTEEQSLTSETLQIAYRADIVVLDWEMMDHGEKALATITQLVKDDEAKGGRYG